MWVFSFTSRSTETHTQNTCKTNNVYSIRNSSVKRPKIFTDFSSNNKIPVGLFSKKKKSE